MSMTTSGTAAAAGAGGSPSTLSTLMQFLPFVLILVVFYFLMIVPQNKERKRREEMLKAIQPGDKVLTRGGVYGIVTELKDHQITIKIAENVKVEIERAFIEMVEKPKITS
jgi:preprotein translocase subunit YajC